MRDNLRPGFLRSNNEPQPGLGTISGSPRCEGGAAARAGPGPAPLGPALPAPAGPPGGRRHLSSFLQLPPPAPQPACAAPHHTANPPAQLRPSTAQCSPDASQFTHHPRAAP